MMQKTLIVFIIMVGAVYTADDVDWTDQDNWDGDCNVGMKQSPINIEPSQAQFCLSSEFNYVQFFCKDFNFEDGVGQVHTVPAVDGAKIVFDAMIDGTLVNAVTSSAQFHFHTPSEHTIRDQSYALQMHIVTTVIPDGLVDSVIDQSEIEQKTSFTNQQLKNKIDNSEANPLFAVLGFLFQVDENAAQNMIIDTDGNVNFFNILSCTSDGYFYRYSGSLTTPPCSEGVQWFVSRRIIKITQGQLDTISAKVVANSNRRVQDLNERTVRFAGTPCHPAMNA